MAASELQRIEFVPVLHRLQGLLAVQGGFAAGELLIDGFGWT